MTPDSDSAWERTVPPKAALEPDLRRSMEEKILSVRRLTEYFYAQSKKAEQRASNIQQQATRRELDFLEAIIRVADSFEDVFGAVEADRRLRKQKEAIEAFRTTFETLLHALENHGVYPVAVLGKSYGQVEFQGVPIPEPWNVVAVASQGDNRSSRKMVSKVLRTLWVRVVNGRLEVLRRAQVIY